eukprot:TRINITY_DN3518_c0_g1_i1.p1 TRINITY_DN3518_c0_g1~~TRINITY_DN3518_c0_g1_i1.p1  ORF type:complete len:426 (+),score=81.97 TRINITY_DN3518_c0_g1_i1:45-1322(+)
MGNTTSDGYIHPQTLSSGGLSVDIEGSSQDSDSNELRPSIRPRSSSGSSSAESVSSLSHPSLMAPSDPSDSSSDTSEQGDMNLDEPELDMNVDLYFGQPILRALQGIGSWTGGDESEFFGFSDTTTAYEADAHPLASYGSRISITEPVSSDVNLNKTSVQVRMLEGNDVGSQKHSLRFLYDSHKELEVLVFTNYNSSVKNLPVITAKAPAGLDRAFVLDEFDLEYKGDRTGMESEDDEPADDEVSYPLVITIRAVPEVTSVLSLSRLKGESNDRVTSQTSYIEVTPALDSPSFATKVVKQIVNFQNNDFVCYDIFGIEQTTVDNPEECVVCLTELRDTVVIPCRHLCICHSCAQVLRYQSNKCPICRGSARAMLRLWVTEEIGSDTEQEDSLESNGDDVVISLESLEEELDAGSDEELLGAVVDV